MSPRRSIFISGLPLLHSILTGLLLLSAWRPASLAQLPPDAEAAVSEPSGTPSPELHPSPASDAEKVEAGAEAEAVPLPDGGSSDSPLTLTPTNAPGTSVDQFAAKQPDHLQYLQIQLDLARQQRRDKSLELAIRTLTSILQDEAPEEFKRAALLELAGACQEAGQFGKAQEVYSQFLQRYAKDPSTPEVLLRQGLLYRQMGLNRLAVAKFYAVMTSALGLKLDRLEYYQQLVLQAQVEIAETYYLSGQYEEASELYGRLLKQQSPNLNRTEIHFKMIRSLAGLKRDERVVGEALQFLSLHPTSPEVPEVRFVCAHSLKRLNRNNEAMQQVLLLLESQHQAAQANPENWFYWQKRAGNEIANQLYQEGDYMSALAIYLSLAQLDRSAAWQIPVWYQIGLTFERLEQPSKATDMYRQIIDRVTETELAESASLKAVVDMARWRRDFLAWLTRAELSSQSIQEGFGTNSLKTATP